ncbi:MAG: HAD-IA family hydrolase [Oscillospiraceae bacterium]|nr:HAD-IA family hydrolase [Oscillospiraceae bacterium]
MRYKLAVFDLDGTLVDSLADLGNACNAALAKHGFQTHETEKYRYFVGDGVPMLIRRALPQDVSDEVREAVHASFDEEYHRSYNVFTRPYDGVKKLLEKLSHSGVLTAVASNKPDVFTQTIVREMFGDVFSYVSGKKDRYEKKPAPGIVFHIMDKLGVSAAETVFIGDSSVDMLTARNAGTDSIGCTWGFRTEAELTENGADYLAHRPEDIYDIITR